MKQEDKELLLKDLCARLPYGVKCSNTLNHRIGILSQVSKTEIITLDIPNYDESFSVDICRIKPYLRPISSMTEEECVELSKIRPFDDEVEAWKYIKTPVPLKIANIKHFNFFHSHHLDWRGLIPMGLALEAHKDMYNIK